MSENQLAVLKERELTATRKFDDERSPLQVINDHHNKLVQDNMLLIDESRGMLLEIDVLTDKLAREREEHEALKIKHQEVSRKLGAIQQGLHTSGQILVDILNGVEKELSNDTAPEAVQAFAPKSNSQKILSEATAGWKQ